MYDRNISFKELLSLDRGLSYGEAEKIGQEIYGRRMGKDIYDSIIALHREGIPINKEKVEEIMEIMNKLHDLREYDEGELIQLLEEGSPVSIETLYRHKHSYNNNSLGQNITSILYEGFTIEDELSMEQITRLLFDANIENNAENIRLVGKFILSGVELSKERLQRLLEIKACLGELTCLLDEKPARLIDEDGPLMRI